MSYPQPSYPLPHEEMLEEESVPLAWCLIGCGAAIALGGLCFCGLIFVVALFNALTWVTPTPSLVMPGPAPQGQVQPIPTPSPSLTPAPPSPPPAPTPSPTPHISQGGIGQRIELNGVSLTAGSVGRVAQDGVICISIDVTIENIGHDVISYGPSDFKIKDSQGFEHTTTCVTDDQGLKSGELSRESSVQGNISFQIPPDVIGLFLVYQPPLPDSYDVLEIDLGP